MRKMGSYANSSAVRLAAAAHVAAALVSHAPPIPVSHFRPDLGAAQFVAAAHHVDRGFLATLELAHDGVDDAVVEQGLEASGSFHGSGLASFRTHRRDRIALTAVNPGAWLMSGDEVIERAEFLLAAACSNINEAAGAYNSVEELRASRYKRHLADALVRVWEAREAIFALRPDLRPPSMPHPHTP